MANAAVRQHNNAPHPRQQRAGARQQRSVFTDYGLIFVILFLLVFGLVMLYSTSSYEAALKYDGDSAYYLKRQLVFSVIGVALMFVMSIFPIGFYRGLSTAVYAAATLMILLIIPFGRRVNGAKRWLYIGPVSVQPAEISKIAVILVTGVLICEISAKELKTLKGMMKILLPAIFQAGLILVITKNLSSAIIVFLIAFGMYFVATRDYKMFFLMLLLGGAAIGGFIYGSVNGILGDFRSDRVLAWLHPENYSDDTAFQTLQALYAIGSGGFFGKGLGQSVQKLGYIPEAQNDMIFSIICEELGLFGAVGIMLMFLILIWRFVIVAGRAEDLYSGMVVVGVITHIAVQVILNIAVVTNFIPNTGVTLPFISYGGTSVVLLLSEIGLVLSIARREEAEGRRVRS